LTFVKSFTKDLSEEKLQLTIYHIRRPLHNTVTPKSRSNFALARMLSPATLGGGGGVGVGKRKGETVSKTGEGRKG